MYRCCNCGQLFEEPHEYQERREFWGAPCYEVFTESPCCHDDYEEVTDDAEEEDDGNN